MRKTLQIIVSMCIALSLALTSLAQEKTVTGKVLDDNNQPIAGATVKLRGATGAVVTDAAGLFSISAKKGETLEISHVGYTATSVKVGDGNNLSLTLKTADNTMGEVIVTAMDIRRNPRELGYSAQNVSGAQIAQTSRENFLNSLQGRVAGLSITPTSGAAGSSSQIVLRGFNSMTLNNQPLFIVDGIILDNSTLNETSNGGTGLGLASDKANRGNDYTNRIADLNPADIESVTVLKGPEATALYGSQASSGAVVITTRKAVPGKTSVTYDNNFRAQFITRFNEINNDYSIGVNGVSSTAPLNATPGSSIQFFGPAFPDGTKKYDNVHDFFRTGFAQTHNIAADFGTKTAGFHLSSSYFDEDGVIPNNDYKKFNIRLANTTKIGKYVNITPTIQYISSINNKPIRGGGGYLLDLYSWPSNNDVRDYQTADGYKKTILAPDYFTESDNPFFSAYNNHGQDKTDRYVATMGIDINPFKWLSVAGRFGYDYYYQRGYQIYSPMSSLTGSNAGITAKAAGGYLDDYWTKYNGYNHTITATAHKEFGKLGVRVLVGTMWQDYETKMWAVSGQNLVDSVSTTTGLMWKNGQSITPAQYNELVNDPYDSTLTRPGVNRLKLARNAFGLPNESITEQLATFGSLQLAFNDYLYLEYTHRFESSSLFTKENRNYNYPGLSFSAIISDMLPSLKGKILDFAKVRISLANTARQPYPYLNQSVFVNNLESSNVGPIYTYGFQNNNPDLRPEKQRTYSAGTELRFFDNRFSLDVTYYNTYAYDQIAQNFRASYATGFVLNTQNAASLRNQGLEIVAGIDVLKKKDLTWNMQLNFNHMWSKVLSLPGSIAYEMYLSDTWLYANARVGFIRGLPATTITSYHYLRNKQGQLIINSTNGLPVIDGTFTKAGDRNPDFTLGAQNSLRYKNWNLSFLWDLRVGGDIFDATDMFLTTIGKSKKTDDRMTPRVINGVLNDGLQNTDHPTPNTIVVIPYTQSTYYTTMPEEEFIQHNVNWFRLRDVTLSYNFQQDVLKRLGGIKRLTAFVTANDLLVFTNYLGADPAVNGNTAGEPGVGAYGFDYGVLPTPVSVNIGFRIGL